MTPAQLAIGCLAAIGLLAWLGTWVELLLLQILNRPYFARGPVLLERTRAVGTPEAGSNLEVREPNLPGFETRRVSSSILLVRRGLTVGSLRLRIAPLWSPRMQVDIACREGAYRMRLQVRHGLCWPIFIVVPVLGAICALLLNPSWALFVFFLACVALAAIPILASVHVAERDADRFWHAVTHASTQSAMNHSVH